MQPPCVLSPEIQQAARKCQPRPWSHLRPKIIFQTHVGFGRINFLAAGEFGAACFLKCSSRSLWARESPKPAFKAFTRLSQAHPQCLWLGVFSYICAPSSPLPRNVTRGVITPQIHRYCLQAWEGDYERVWVPGLHLPTLPMTCQRRQWRKKWQMIEV